LEPLSKQHHPRDKSIRRDHHRNWSKKNLQVIW
jgi:hypothetical protein